MLLSFIQESIGVKWLKNPRVTTVNTTYSVVVPKALRKAIEISISSSNLCK